MYSALDTFESLFMKEEHASSIGKNISNNTLQNIFFSIDKKKQSAIPIEGSSCEIFRELIGARYIVIVYQIKT